MILVLSGTRDAVEIIRLLKSRGFEVLATAVTDYGATLSKKAGADHVMSGALDDTGMAKLIEERNCAAVIDATHPFAVDASRNAMSTCTKLGIGYLRYERKPASLQKSPLVHYTEDIGCASEMASRLGGVIFYTAGSRGLEAFLKRARGERVVVRVLPDEGVIKRCLDLGIGPGDIIAMQGPFSVELNRTMMEECGADVLVTKESGPVGGVREKVSAALYLDIPVVVIERPEMEYPEVVEDYQDVIEWISKNS